MRYIILALLIICNVSLAQKTNTISSTKKEDLPTKVLTNNFANRTIKQDCSAMIFVSTQNINMDWWYKVSPNSAPQISEIKKVFHNQDFNIFTFVSKPSIKDGKFRVRYDITMTYPDAKVETLVKDALIEGDNGVENMIIACQDVLSGIFDDSYPEGRYIFEISIFDEFSGQRKSDKTYVQLKTWTAPNPFLGKELVNKYISYFYLQSTPENLYSIFFSNDLSLEQVNAPNALNYRYIGFFRSAFENNKFLLPKINESFKNLKPKDRAKVIFLFYILGNNSLDKTLFTQEESAYQEKLDKAHIPQAYGQWSPIVGSTQIDMLYGDFFANGTYKPILRIIDLLSLRKEINYANEMLQKKEKPKNKEEADKFLMGMLAKSAFMTLAYYAQEYMLIEEYCIWALRNGNLNSDVSQELAPMIDSIQGNIK